jgi:hypothetical protein
LLLAHACGILDGKGVRQQLQQVSRPAAADALVAVVGPKVKFSGKNVKTMTDDR